MTNRELAERIADAVIEAFSITDTATVVLDVLRDTGHAFVRLDTDATGATVERCMDDEADAMEARALKVSKQIQRGLFTENT